MTLSIKGLLFLIAATILQTPAFSQEPESALSYYNKGELLINQAPVRSFQLLEKAMTISRQNKDWNLYLKSLNKLASLKFDDEEKQAQVFDWLKDALEVLEDSERTEHVALLHYNLAKYYSDLTYEIDTPIKYFESAKTIWTSLKGEENEQVASCYHGLGDIYKYSKFDFYEAEKSYEKALSIRQNIHFQNFGILYRNYYNLAATNRSQLDFDKALSYGSKTLEVAKKLTSLHVEMGNGMVANIYRDMGESESAKKYYLDALALNVKTKNLETRAWYFLCLGETFKNDSVMDEALKYFKRAHKLYSLPQVKDPDLFLNLLINMMETYSKIKDSENFIKIRKEIFKELGSRDKLDSREGAQAWLYVGDHHYRMMRYDSALLCYQNALVASVPSFRSHSFFDNPQDSLIGFRYYVNEILAKKALALHASFSKTGEIDYLKQSLLSLKLAEKLFSKQRTTLDIDAAKWQFLEANYNLYNYDIYENILSNLDQGSNSLPEDTVNRMAFQYFEQSKSRMLADALAQTEQNKQISDQDSIFRLHGELKRQLFRAQDLINRELEKANVSDKISALRQDVVKLDQQIQACKLTIEEKYPGYFNVKYGFGTASIKEVQKIMKDKGQVLLEYFWGNKSVYGLCVADERVSFRKIGTPDSVKALVNGLLLHLADEHSTMNQESFQSFTSNSNKLYKILIEPFRSLLSDEKRIQIIPDGAISQVPFEILLEEKSNSAEVNYRSLKYLIKSFTIGYAYTSSMLIHSRPVRHTSQPTLLAIGFTGGQRLRTADSKLEEITGAEEELKALEKLFNEGKFLVGKEATESNFKSLAPQFDIIHLAVHGMGDVQKAFAASLYFRSKYDKKDDGELHAYELYGLKFKALMAVLSSCESGVGKGFRGEGMISMASAFTYSGCENILMSLWKVNDQASILLMDDFYKHLSKGGTIDEALRTAKLNYLETADELTADPKIWAPLVAYGSLEPVFQKDKSRIFAIIGIVCCFMVLLLTFRFYKKNSQTH
jgi:CHAT domain-containing protein